MICPCYRSEWDMPCLNIPEIFVFSSCPPFHHPFCVVLVSTCPFRLGMWGGMALRCSLGCRALLFGWLSHGFPVVCTSNMCCLFQVCWRLFGCWPRSERIEGWECTKNKWTYTFKNLNEISHSRGKHGYMRSNWLTGRCAFWNSLQQHNKWAWCECDNYGDQCLTHDTKCSQDRYTELDIRIIVARDACTAKSCCHFLDHLQFPINNIPKDNVSSMLDCNNECVKWSSWCSIVKQEDGQAVR